MIISSFAFRYGVFKIEYVDHEKAVVYTLPIFGKITVPLIILLAYILLLMLKELWQLFKFKKRYFGVCAFLHSTSL